MTWQAGMKGSCGHGQVTPQQEKNGTPVITLITVLADEQTIILPALGASANCSHTIPALMTQNNVSAAMILADLAMLTGSIVHGTPPSFRLRGGWPCCSSP
jgi:hypothetical protein